MSVNSSNSTVFFKDACYTKPGAERKQARSNLYISMQFVQTFSHIRQLIMKFRFEHSYEIHQW